MEVADKVVVVTGGAHGIGRAMAARFHKEGAKAVVIADREAGAAETTAAEIGVHAMAADVSDEQAITQLIDQVTKKFGPIDLFCSNAGIGDPGRIDASNKVWDRAWSVNLMAHVYAARILVPQMLERGGGYLLQTASAAGLLSQFEAPYAVTKHAAVAYAEWLSITYGKQGLKVSCLCPMGVDTRMLQSAPDTQRELMSAPGVLSPDAVAEIVLEGIREEKFLILPHSEVLSHWQAKTRDYEGWLKGMREFHAMAGE